MIKEEATMSLSGMSLDRQTAPEDLLGILNLQAAQTLSLKARACPLCHTPSLNIMPDMVHGGEWMYCRRCQFGGDVIEFVARRWKLSVETAVDTLIDEGVITASAESDEVRQYVDHHAGYRERLRMFWEVARRKPVHDSTIATRILLRRFSQSEPSLHGDWLTRGGRIFGITDFASLANLYASSASPGANSTKQKRSIQSIQAQVAAHFSGEGWEELVITPIYDLPGRISGFVAVGREGDVHAGDYVCLPARLLDAHAAQQELGIAMLSVLDADTSPDLRNIVVLVDDPEVAMMLHGMHCRDSRLALPLVVIPQGRIPRNPLPPPLPKKGLIFWGPSKMFLALAKRYDGYLADLPVRKGGSLNLRNIPSAVHCLRSVLRNAVPWSVIAERKAIEVKLVAGEGQGSCGKLIGIGDERDGFRFPQFSIRPGGEIRFAKGLAKLVDTQRPGAFLHPPTGDFAAVLKTLTHDEVELKAFWAMTACILHNLIAQQNQTSPSGIILDGVFTQTEGVEAAKMLGCVEVDLSHRTRNLPLLEAIRNAVLEQAWPTLIRFNERSRRIITPAWLKEPALRNTILPLDDYAALALGMHGGFVRMFSPESPKPVEGLLNLAARIIPEYLQDFCRRGQNLEPTGDHRLLDVLFDLAEWIERLGGDPGSVVAASTFLHFDDQNPAATFVQLAQRMQDRGDLCIFSQGISMNDHRRAEDSPLELTPLKIGIDSVRETLRRKRAPEIDLQLIEEDLRSQDAWIGSKLTGNGRCWLISATWWNATLNPLPDASIDDLSEDARKKSYSQVPET
jgi:hypothetical protein